MLAAILIASVTLPVVLCALIVASLGNKEED